MEETVIQKILSESYNVCNSASAKGFDIKRVLRSYDSKKNRQELQSSYKLQMPLVSHCSYEVFSNPSAEWE